MGTGVLASTPISYLKGASLFVEEGGGLGGGRGGGSGVGRGLIMVLFR